MTACALAWPEPMVADNAYSHLVAWLKILLPLMALAILSSIFLVSRAIDPNDAIPYAEVDVADRIRDPRVTGPVFAGMTGDGAALTVTADEMRPNRDDAAEGSAQGLRARIETPDGAVTDILAAVGRVDTKAQTLDFGGGVEITSSSGYRIAAPEMTGSLVRTDFAATGGVTAEGPLGSIASGRLRITGDATAGGYLLVFNDRVRLIYRPQSVPAP